MVVVCLLMILLVLMQRPKQDGLGAAFGGGMMDGAFGAGASNVLQRGTVWLAIAFFVLSLLLSVLMSKNGSKDDDLSITGGKTASADASGATGTAATGSTDADITDAARAALTGDGNTATGTPITDGITLPEGLGSAGTPIAPAGINTGVDAGSPSVTGPDTSGPDVVNPSLLDNAADTTSGAATGALDAANDGAGMIKDGAGAAAETTGDAVEGAGGLLKKAAGAVKDGAGAAAEATGDAAKGAGNLIKDGASAAAETTGDAVEGAGGLLKKAAGAVKDGAGAAVEAVTE